MLYGGIRVSTRNAAHIVHNWRKPNKHAGFVWVIAKQNIVHNAIHHMTHKSPRPQRRVFCPAHHVDNVDNQLNDCPHCPQMASHTVLGLHTVVCLGSAALCGQPTVSTNVSEHTLTAWWPELEGEGVGPSGWANGSVALSNNFYFYGNTAKDFLIFIFCVTIRARIHAAIHTYEFPFTATCHQRSARHRGGA